MPKLCYQSSSENLSSSTENILSNVKNELSSAENVRSNAENVLFQCCKRIIGAEIALSSKCTDSFNHKTILPGGCYPVHTVERCLFLGNRI